MNEIIERIKEKIKNCETSTQEDRARKGAYVDCIVMIKESGNLPEAVSRNAVLADVLAELEKISFIQGESNRLINFGNMEQVLRKYFSERISSVRR